MNHTKCGNEIRIGSNTLNHISSINSLSRINDLCVCPICLDNFCFSITLPCGHSYDRDCILNFALKLQKPSPHESAASNASKYFKCPVCRRVHGISDLGSMGRNHILDQISFLLSPSQYKQKQHQILKDSQVHQLLKSNGMFVQDLVPVSTLPSTFNSTTNFTRRLLLLGSGSGNENSQLISEQPCGLTYTTWICFIAILTLILYGLPVVIKLREASILFIEMGFVFVEHASTLLKILPLL